MRLPVLTSAAVFAALTLSSTVAVGGEGVVPLPAPAVDVRPSEGLATAVFAGGCFWGLEAVFEQVKGVRGVTNGYAGGTRETASYEQVSTERTGHAEAIRIQYDPRVVSYGTLLRIFFSAAHDPTQLNRQGPDTGPSYRSAIFPQSPAQRGTAQRYLAQLAAAKPWPGKIVTRIENGSFFPAEAHHQDFARRNPTHPYIVRWDKPKVVGFRASYPALVR